MNVAAWFERIPSVLRSAVGSIVEGFEEHGWSGKLFMITTAVAAVLPLLGGLAWVVSSWLSGFGIFPYVPVILLFSAPVVLFQLRLLLGIARFEGWARWLAMAGSVFGVLTGLASLTLISGAQFWVMSAAQVALSTQFLVYFSRNGDRFRRRALREAPAVGSLLTSSETDRLDR
jgi:hypothetical protein